VLGTAWFCVVATVIVH